MSQQAQQIESYHRSVQQLHQQQQPPQQPPQQIQQHLQPQSNLPITVSGIDASGVRHRISLLQHSNEYPMARSQTQQPQADPSGPPAIKKIRLGIDNSQNISNQTVVPPPSSIPPHQQQQPQISQQQPTLLQPVVQTQPPSTGQSNVQPQILKVEARDPPASSGIYHPKVEAISPTLPNDPIEEIRTTKDELLQQIHIVDTEIQKTEKTIQMLRKKEQSLEEASAKPATRLEEVAELTQTKHLSPAQKIYADNRKVAVVAHAVLSSFSPAIELPLYNQPSDADICRENIQRYQSFKSRLLLHFRKIKSDRMIRNTSTSERYGQMSVDWRARVEKVEASAKRKGKEAKNRELFEKVNLNYTYKKI